MAAEILRECANWVRQQGNIQNVYNSNGGWEKWAQLDFGGHLRSKNHRVNHDDRAFAGSSETVSFTVQGMACVELKTFGHQFNTIEPLQTFKSRMQAARCRLERMAPNPECKDNDMFLIGLSNQNDIIAGLRYMFNNNNICATNFMKILKGAFPEYEHAPVQSPSGARWIISFCKVD